MLPPEEIRMLDAALREAWRLANEGKIAEGYAVLDLGMLWAETPALDPVTLEQSPPDPWTEELTALYRAALMRYAAEHGTVVAEPSLVWEGSDPQRDLPAGSGRDRSLKLCPAFEKAISLQEEARVLCAAARMVRHRAEAVRLKCAERRGWCSGAGIGP